MTSVIEESRSLTGRGDTEFSPTRATKRAVALLAITFACIVAGVAVAATLGRRAAAQDVIRDDSYFYGQSPPVYPSPEMTGSGDWADAFNSASDLVGRMTLEEKVTITAGVPPDNGCVGFVPPITRVGFPGMCMMDAGQGVRGTDFVTSFPSGIHVGASWNKNLTYWRAFYMGDEFKTKGVNVLLGPVVGPLGRVVKGGRIWEGISTDPYLSGSLVQDTVRGSQDAGVITSTKHFIANEQELHRNPVGDVASVSENMDDRTMHELYLWPFQDAVKAGTANIMCSYQRLNNSYGCQNSKTLNGLLKDELGFQGFVVTDWGAQHAGYAGALAGLDMAMPGGDGFWGSLLVEAVKNGSIPEERVTDMATRIIGAWYRLGQADDFPEPGVGMPRSVIQPHTVVDARKVESRSTVFDGAVEGHVLVKNAGSLPLRSPRMISIFGYSAKAPDNFSPTGGSDPWILGASSLADFSELNLAGPTVRTFSAIALNGTLIGGGGSGGTSPSALISPFDALKMRAYQDRTAVFWDFTRADPGVDPGSDACIVFGNAWSTESYDRPSLRDDYTDGLIRNVASGCANTIVVFHNAGVRLVDQIVDHPNVTAIIFAHLPGENSGPAIAALLYGDENFSGKLPYTVARNESDYGAVLDHAVAEGAFANFPQSEYSEGVYTDYRRFDANGLEPRYEFGFGLSYTTFEYDNLSVAAVEGAGTDELPTGAVRMGGQADLWDVLVRVAATVRNTGEVAGKEVAQLYIGIPGIPGDDVPARQLRGFAKAQIEGGAEARVEFELTRRDLSRWDTTVQRWRLAKGEHAIYVGASSRNLPLRGNITI